MAIKQLFREKNEVETFVQEVKMLIKALKYSLSSFLSSVNMANFSASNFTNMSSKLKASNTSKEGGTPSSPLDTNLLIPTLINGITCPFTVLLNVLVIAAVVRRPRLQNNSNILLACLAVTDTITGLIAQPSFVLWNTLQLLGSVNRVTVGHLHSAVLRGLAVCSSLHLMLVTCERLIAIRFTMHYPYIVINQNIKAAVIAFWIFSVFQVVFGLKETNNVISSILNVSAALVVISCVIFIAFSYVILYRETVRHRKRIKNQQLPQEEVERFAKESRALKTTVLVVGAVILCFVPIAFTVLLFIVLNVNIYSTVTVNSCLPCPWINTFVMLNSFVNPLIYCWRQKEMRQFVFRLSSPAVAPSQN